MASAEDERWILDSHPSEPGKFPFLDVSKDDRKSCQMNHQEGSSQSPKSPLLEKLSAFTNKKPEEN